MCEELLMATTPEPTGEKRNDLKFRFVIFDFDGTLADTLGWVASQMPDIASRYGSRSLDPPDYDHIRVLPPDELLSYGDTPLETAPDHVGAAPQHARRRE